MDLRKLVVIVSLVLAGCAVPLRSAAQFIGYTSPQTVQQTLATNLACTGSPQLFNISNLGQTQHYLSVSNVNNAATFTATINGIDSQGNVFAISDVMALAGYGNVRAGSVTASGYFPKIQVSVTCTSVSGFTANFTASYSGAWGTFNTSAGAYQVAQIDKSVFNQVPANTNQSASLQVPFGSSAGTLLFQYGPVGVAGGSLQILCNALSANSTVSLSVPLQNSTALQPFTVPSSACSSVSLQYTSPGVTTALISVEYVFSYPGLSAPAYQFTHITGTTATAVKATAGFLHTLNVNTGGAGTISVFDLAAAACTGTPATNVVAVITATATTLQTFTYDTNLLNGICVKASVAMDFTVSSQ